MSLLDFILICFLFIVIAHVIRTAEKNVISRLDKIEGKITALDKMLHDKGLTVHCNYEDMSDKYKELK